MEITVSGTGRSSLRPERATMHLTAGFESGDKAEAMSEATRVVNELSADLRRLKELDPSPTTWSAVLPIGTRSRGASFKYARETLPVTHQEMPA